MKDLNNHQYTWLVTGAAGFIGSHLTQTLLTHNQKVIGIDNFATGKKENLTEFSTHKNFTFKEGDICDLNFCKQVTKVDHILHQAALGSVPRSIQFPELTNANNVGGTLNIFIAAKDNKVKRVVYASSSSVYGDHPALPKVEENIGKPLSPYAASKYFCEVYGDVFAKTYGLETIGLRYFNVFGPRQDPHGPYAAVIPLWLKSLKENLPVFINGDGTTSRDFCYVKNAVQANILAALAPSTSANLVYNVACSQQTSLNELFEMMKDEFKNRGFKIDHLKPEYRNFRSGDVKHSLANISKAQNLLGYQPTHLIKDGLLETIQWFLK